MLRSDDNMIATGSIGAEPHILPCSVRVYIFHVIDQTYLPTCKSITDPVEGRDSMVQPWPLLVVLLPFWAAHLVCYNGATLHHHAQSSCCNQHAHSMQSLQLCKQCEAGSKEPSHQEACADATRTCMCWGTVTCAQRHTWAQGMHHLQAVDTHTLQAHTLQVCIHLHTQQHRLIPLSAQHHRSHPPAQSSTSPSPCCSQTAPCPACRSPRCAGRKTTC
jgi:hypothetical protein